MNEAKTYLERYEKAKTARRFWEPVFEECYEYALPQRESFYNETPGQRRDDKIFDETAVVGVQEFASRLQAGIVPNFARWADLVSGSEVPPEQRDEVDNDLDEVTEYVFEVLQNSNFSQEVHESFLDLAVGTGVLAVDEGDAVNPVVFTALPLPHVVLDTGPDDKIDTVYRERKKVKYKQLPLILPSASFSQKISSKMQGDDETTLIEIVHRNYEVKNEEAYKYIAICKDSQEILHQKEMKGVGSNPFICFRWSKCAGERYGRGPLMHALSAIKTTNLTIEMILENAQMSIAGMYQYEDDGIINPETINLVPGTLIPVSAGSRGLQPVGTAGNFNVADLVLNDQRLNIKKALFNDMLADPNRTPATATEVAERMADLSRRMGSAFGRLQAELVQPVLQRVIYILKKQGRITLPTVNGREVKIRSVSPLAQAQANQDIASVARYLELVGGVFGPETMQLIIDPEQVAVHLAKKFGVPDNLIRDENERKQISEMIRQAAQQQMMAQNAQQQEPVGP